MDDEVTKKLPFSPLSLPLLTPSSHPSSEKKIHRFFLGWWWWLVVPFFKGCVACGVMGGSVFFFLLLLLLAFSLPPFFSRLGTPAFSRMEERRIRMRQRERERRKSRHHSKAFFKEYRSCRLPYSAGPSDLIALNYGEVW